MTGARWVSQRAAGVYRRVSAARPLVAHGSWLDLRTWLLLSLAVICGSRGIVYAFDDEPLPYGLRNIAALLPPWVYAVLWAGTCGVLAVAAARQWPMKPWHGIAVGMPVLWGMFYAAGAAVRPSDRFVSTFGNAWLWWAVGLGVAVTLMIPPGVVSMPWRRPEPTE
ncbi:hypothetical protein FDO65_10150 [Nakamurella flava]|uniref:Uncharacterized protein n=1 Tax=Nakamurella flava TaxID=2576308 RepID=A0A4U6QP78_9ACTN|nr:hypothetical protein [Nakamurella flava]TKV61876.1 hypothetical protein FDO65_10150 [Nakamurella flava]